MPLRLALVVGLVAAAAGCGDVAPAARDDLDGEDAALVAIVEAYEVGDCDRVIDRAAGFSASTALRLDAVTYRYGRCFYQTGRFGEAAEVLDRLGTATPPGRYGAASAYFAARARYRDGRVDAARDGLTAFLSRFRRSPYRDDAVYWLGRALYRAGDPERARVRFDETLGLADAPDAHREGATFFGGRCSYKLALDDGDGADAVDFGVAWDRYAAVLDGWPDGWLADNARYGQGKVRYRQGRYDEAAALFAGMPEAHPDSGLLDLSLYFEARARSELGDLPGALALLDAFAERYPGSAFADNAAYRRGRVLYAMGVAAADQADPSAPSLLGRAADAFAALRATWPESTYGVSAAYFLGRAQYRLSRWAAALEALAGPGSADGSVWQDNARYYAGKARYHVGRTTGSAAHLRQAAEALDALPTQHPASPYRAGATYYAGRAMHRLGDRAAAGERYRAVVDGYADSTWVDNALHRLVAVALEGGDCGAAGEALEALRRAAPDGAWVTEDEAAVRRAGCP